MPEPTTPERLREEDEEAHRPYTPETPVAPSTPATVGRYTPGTPLAPSTPKSAQSIPYATTPALSPGLVVTRKRLHELITDSVWKSHTCKRCEKSISSRASHLRCNQCGQRFHKGCESRILADCQPPAFGSKQAKAIHRIKPRMGCNLLRAVRLYSNSGSIPGIVEDCIAALRRRGLDADGLFRHSGSKKTSELFRVKYFEEKKPPSVADLVALVDINDIATILKDFLRNLDEPLITFSSHDDFMRAMQTKDRSTWERNLCDALKTLPVVNFHTLESLMNLFVE